MEKTTQNQLNINHDSSKSMTPYLILRKDKAENKSANNPLLYIDKRSKFKVSFTLKNNNDFFQRDNVEINLRKIYTTFSEKDLVKKNEKMFISDPLKNENSNEIDKYMTKVKMQTKNDIFSNFKQFNQENNTFKEITFEKNYQNIHKLDSKISNNNKKKLNKNDKILDYSNKNNFESKCQIESKPTAKFAKEEIKAISEDISTITEKDISLLKSKNMNVMNTSGPIPLLKSKTKRDILNLFDKIKKIDDRNLDLDSGNQQKTGFKKTISNKPNKYNSLVEKHNISIESNQTIENEFSIRKNNVCFICEVQINSDNYVKFTTCKHIFCYKCGKGFYEDKIEQGEKKLKCPSYTCFSEILSKTLELLVSEMHFKQFSKQIEKSLELGIASYQVIKPKLTLRNMSTIKVKNDLFKLYSQKHVLDVTNDNTFIGFNRAKEWFCNKCYEPALFGKLDKNFVKCLNCSQFFCKFCMKDLGIDHFDSKGSNSCRIFYRIKSTNDNTKTSKCLKSIVYYLLVYIVSYFILVFGVINIINEMINEVFDELCKKTVFCCKIVYILLWIFLCFPLIIVFWLIIPFFPLIILLFK